MARVPDLDESQTDPFGPDASPAAKPERYNTRYIIADLKKSELRTRLVVVGAIALIAAAVLFILSSRPPKVPEAGLTGEAGEAAVAVPSADSHARPH